MIHLDINPPTIADDAPPFLPFGITVYPQEWNNASSVALTIYDPVTKNFVSIPGIPATINAAPATVSGTSFTFSEETTCPENHSFSSSYTNWVLTYGALYTYVADISAFLLPDEYIRRLKRTLAGSCCGNDVVSPTDTPCAGMHLDTCTPACIGSITGANWQSVSTTGYSILLRVDVVTAPGATIVSSGSATGTRYIMPDENYSYSTSIVGSSAASFRMGPVSQLYNYTHRICNGDDGGTSGSKTLECQTSSWTYSGVPCSAGTSQGVVSVDKDLPLYGGYGRNFNGLNTNLATNSGDPITGLPFGVASLHTLNSQCPLTTEAFNAIVATQTTTTGTIPSGGDFTP